MKTIALVTQKGGAGKSTLAFSLGVAALETGERVCLVDLDPLATLTNWGVTRDETDVPVLLSTADKLPAALAMLAAHGVTLAILDTPGAGGATAEAAMAAAQLCIIPARPNAFDLRASEITRKALKKAHCDYVFVLNQCPPAQQSARIEEGVAALEAMGGLLSPLVRARVDYQEAARLGLGVTELNPNGPAASEIRALWASLKKRLAKCAKPARKVA